MSKLPKLPPVDRYGAHPDGNYSAESMRSYAIEAAEYERLRFEGDLDKWMKAIGAGITGYQPEAYAVMDAACEELARSRGEILRVVLFLQDLRDGAYGEVPQSWKDAINRFVDDPTPSEIGWRQRQGGSE